ncbi:polysaccharide deacetylase family protein [Terriglobus aquaticus]|uniref:Polysaccharide deacetylase family protein n=2 Tax=Terriglobus aquaticus TaxID=940139 RepID=A0ABW9KGC1_9BACT
MMAELPATSYEPIVTFDDGHVSNYTYALPALEASGRSAFFFITAGWTGVRPDYMDKTQLRALHTAGHGIGAHGWTHTLLTQCSAADLRHELVDARSALEDAIGAPVTSLSLPGGRSNAAVIEACHEAGYTTVWTSVPGAVKSSSEATVGRFNILAGHSDAFLQRLLDPASGELARAARVGRWKAMAQRVMGDAAYARLWALLNRKEGDATDPGAQRVDGAL